MKALVLCLCALPAMAGEYAVLSNGFRIHADRHEKLGDTIRLESENGVTEFPAAWVVRFEQEEYVPPAPVPAAPPQPAAKPTLTPKELVDAAARKAELPAAIVHAVAKAESAYHQDAVSPKGAIGIMQLMPETAKQLQADPKDAQQNTEAGAKYLRDLLVKYDGDVAKALAAYNAGPGAVDKYGDVPPYPETRSYVNRVIQNYKKLGGE